jgi:hypothetical protein
VDGRIERLLTAVWGNRSGYVFLPFKDRSDDSWHETNGLPYSGVLPSYQEPNGKTDQYFCPVVFNKPKRVKENALPTNLLWADLDPVHPDTCRIKPSVAWESSPGRYQALWFLTEEVSGEEAASLSKRIAYADGGDKGGWDLTQVLRIPGTKNYKYDSHPEVRILWAKSSGYAPEEIKGAYPAVEGNGHHVPSLDWPPVDEATINMALAALPQGYKKRLIQNTQGADRSLELQKLARDLVRFGVSPEIVIHLLQRSSWNKFAGRSDEHQQLLKQVTSAVEAVELKKQSAETPKLEEVAAMRVTTWGQFLQQPTHLRWLVDDSWVEGSVGFISGRSKSYKTWIALDLALSVVSGVPFLGRYGVGRTGPVLLIQEEDPTSVLQERIRLIAKNKGMLPVLKTARSDLVEIEYPEWPLHIINLQGFNLGSTEKVAQVRRLIAEINPIMVILDPLIVLLPQGVDEYKGVEVSAVLQSIKMWREEFGCAVAIVHHWNKGKSENGERFAEHMYGSFAFHAWLESALHVMPIIPDGEDEEKQITSVLVEREFKAAPSGRGLRLKFHIDSTKDYSYSVEFEDSTTVSAKEQTFLDFLAQSGPSTSAEMITSMGRTRQDISTIGNRLLRAKLVLSKKGGGRGNTTMYWLPDQEPPE